MSDNRLIDYLDDLNGEGYTDDEIASSLLFNEIERPEWLTLQNVNHHLVIKDRDAGSAGFVLHHYFTNETGLGQ